MPILLTIIRPLVYVLFILAVLQPFAGIAATATRRDVAVMADPSMTVALTLIARSFAATNNASVSVEFGSTKEQIKAIEDGAACDVLISGKPGWIDKMQAHGLIDAYSRTPVAKASLVLVATPGLEGPRDLKKGVHAKAFAGGQDVAVGLGDPEWTAEGTYALESLRRLRLDSELEPNFSFFRDPRKLIDATARYRGYGFVFASDALLFPQVAALANVPEDKHGPILIQAVVVTGENMDGGRRFSDYLTSDAARTILATHGFDVNL